jgi:acetyl esterase/lipase
MILIVGGGYGYGEVKCYFPVLLNLYDQLAAVSDPTSFLFLDYSLTPGAKYPTQLVEAAQAYHYLINDLKIDPGRITVGGDSAGGNLSLQLFRHIAEPHPDVPITFPSSARPSKCILSSPWVTMDHNCPSFELNKKRDVMIKEKVEWYSKRWKGDHSDLFTDPLKAPADSWKAILPSTLVISGDQELFIDDIREICDKFKKVLSAVLKLICRVESKYLKIIGEGNIMIGGGWRTVCEASSIRKHSKGTRSYEISLRIGCRKQLYPWKFDYLL